jgi:rRNA-processing protein FCF1
MELVITTMVGLVLIETTYLAYRSMRSTGTVSKGDILLDTSVLIDGRILAIARSGLVSSRLIVPRSVVRELQFMADKADHDKRERARFGLDVIEKLQQLPGLTLEIRDDGDVSEHGVDEQLIIIAQKSGAKLCTIDYNLNKAARVQSVEIVNINELAHALRVVHLPGEKIAVSLVQPGQDRKQAVGYLDDGTMVVVDDARELIGESVDVELTRVLQTTAGKMMFAKRVSASQTRGAAKGGGRMIAKQTQSASSQTPREAKVRRQMTASQTPRQNATKDRSQMIAKQTPSVSPEPPRETKQSSSSQPRTPKPTNSRRSSRKPRSAEDSMVDLANK